MREWVSDGERTVIGFENHDDYELKVLRGGCWVSSKFEVKLTACSYNHHHLIYSLIRYSEPIKPNPS